MATKKKFKQPKPAHAVTERVIEAMEHDDVFPVQDLTSQLVEVLSETTVRKLARMTRDDMNHEVKKMLNSKRLHRVLFGVMEGLRETAMAEVEFLQG